MSSLNESMIAGESRPVKKATGDKVIAGTINGDETALAGVMRLVEQAQQSKSQTQGDFFSSGISAPIVSNSLTCWQIVGNLRIQAQGYSFEAPKARIEPNEIRTHVRLVAGSNPARPNLRTSSVLENNPRYFIYCFKSSINIPVKTALPASFKCKESVKYSGVSCSSPA